ncbi:MAG: SDR family oxidoreductase [Planctomycetes bacterium]|nr:SDR family oxidoreductase [Planctomycetota bacterium]
MRCLIVGGDGMLGHQLLLSWRGRYETRVTLRGGLAQYLHYGLFSPENAYGNVEVRDTERLLEILSEFRPDAVVNAVGIIKQRSAAKAAIPSLEVNALFPHRLNLLCRMVGARLVHISTDCVFSGRRGNYREEEPADAEDLYGLSKYLGEVSEPPAVTLRSSIIGLELKGKQSLIEWFLAQRGGIRGFTRAVYTGVTTAEMARVIEHVLVEHPQLNGVWQVASEPINKYDLLCKLSALLGRQDVVIEPDDALQCDRSLCGDAFSRETGYAPPSWDQMLQELSDAIQQRRWNCEAA